MASRARALVYKVSKMGTSDDVSLGPVIWLVGRLLTRETVLDALALKQSHGCLGFPLEL